MGAVRSAELAIEPEQSRLTLEGTGIGIWEWTVDTGEVRWSGNVEQLFGLPLGKLGSTYSEFMQIVHPDDRSALEGQRAAALAGRPGYVQVEYRVNQPDGGAIWIVDSRAAALWPRHDCADGATRRQPLLRTRAARPRIGPVVRRRSASRERSIATSSG